MGIVYIQYGTVWYSNYSVTNYALAFLDLSEA